MKGIKKMLVIYGMVIAIIANIIPVKANAKNTDVNRNFEEASDNIVVCYYMGYPIKKNQIDKNRCIKESVVSSIEKEISDTNDEKQWDIDIWCSSDELNKGVIFKNSVFKEGSKKKKTVLTIPKGYRQAIVKVQTSAPRFSQTVTYMYFTKSNANKFANGITYNNKETVAACIAGFIPHVGAIITIACTIDGLRKSEVSSRIREYTDAGYKVKVTKIDTTGYGHYYAVSKWTGRRISYKTFKDRYASQTLVGISYK